MNRNGRTNIGDGGIRDVLRVSLPLILASSCQAANMFTDRMMLSHHSQEAVAAAMTGGLTNFTLSCLFFGMVMYTGTFVAQYSGARAYDRIGPAVWQGIFLSLLGGVFMFSTLLWVKPLFESFGHAPDITRSELVYYRILTYGAVSNMLNGALSSFWSGRGKTGFVLCMSLLMTVLNIPFNYILIFGIPAWHIPAMGIAGAAWGTILASFVGTILYAAVFFAPSSRRHFGTAARIIQPDLFRRLLRFGFPSGIQLIIDLAAFNTFVILIGRYGANPQEAASITFGINNIAFCPVMGIGTSASILVGQAIGASDIFCAKRATKNAVILALAYTTSMVLLFTILPDLVLAPFVRPDDPAQAASLDLAKKMLIFIAAYLFFDGCDIVFSNAIRGAGDTKACMFIIMCFGWGVFAIPALIMHLCGAGLWTLWFLLDFYIIAQAAAFWLRYRGGKWTKMKVIEDAPQTTPETA